MSTSIKAGPAFTLAGQGAEHIVLEASARSLNLSLVDFRRSTRCENNQCVEVGVSEFGIHMRQSDGGVVLTFDRAQWQGFICSVKGGQFG